MSDREPNNHSETSAKKPENDEPDQTHETTLEDLEEETEESDITEGKSSETNALSWNLDSTAMDQNQVDAADVSLNETVIEESTESVLPELEFELERTTFWLIRGDETLLLSDEFRPMDLLTLIFQPTGITKQSYVKMIDDRDQVRYHGKSGGFKHKFVTRVQNTRSFGSWKFLIEAPMKATEEVMEMEIPFSIVEEYSDEEEIEVEIIDHPSGYRILFHDQEEEMFQIVEKPPLVAVDGEEELPEAIIEEEIAVMISEEEFVKAEKIAIVNIDLPDLKIPVNEIHGIGPSYKKKLEDKEILYVHHLLPYEPDELSELIGVTDSKCRNWIAEARDIANDEMNSTYLEFKKVPTEEEKKPMVVEKVEFEILNTGLADLQIPVTEIKGIGPATQKKLATQEIEYVHHLVHHNPVTLSQMIGVSESKCSNWISIAREIAVDDQHPIFLRFTQQEIIKERPEQEIGVKVDEIEIPDVLISLKIPVTEIKGIGPATQKKLSVENIEFVHDLVPLDSEQLSTSVGIPKTKCDKWITNAREIATNDQHPLILKYKQESKIQEIREEELVSIQEEIEISEDIKNLKIPLTEIKGIGPATQKKLAKQGIEFVHDLASKSILDLSELSGITKSKLTNWAEQAKDIVENPQNEIYLSYKEN